MFNTNCETSYIIFNFISEYKILIYSLNKDLTKLNQITLMRRPVSSLYLLRLLGSVYNVNKDTIIGVTGKYNQKGRYFSVIYGYAYANDIMIKKVDFYQACERVNFRYKMIDSNKKLVDWYKKYEVLLQKMEKEDKIKFLNSEIDQVISNRSEKEKIIFRKTIIMLLYLYVRDSLYKTVKKSIQKRNKDIIPKTKVSKFKEDIFYCIE